MGRHAIAFISYDPYSDQRIAPQNHRDLLPHKELPPYIHDAVFRAKDLVGHLSHEELMDLAAKIDRYILGASGVAFFQGSQSERNYRPANESDRLLSFLMHGKHQEPTEDWAKLFGGLTLCLAGEIINTLWPSNEYLHEVEGELNFIAQCESDGLKRNFDHSQHVLDLTFEAVKAVGLGEGFLHAASEQKRREQNRINASGLSPDREKLYEGFCKWVTGPENAHRFGSIKKAVSAYKDELKEKDNELHKHIANRTHETMARHLKKYCESRGEPYPF